MDSRHGAQAQNGGRRRGCWSCGATLRPRAASMICETCRAAPAAFMRVTAAMAAAEGLAA